MPAPVIRLLDRRDGEVVTLADVTPWGGSMHGRELAAGTKVSIAWHSPREAPDWTFVHVWSEDDRQWWGPVAVAATARIATVLEPKAPPKKTDASKKGVDVDDPLQRRLADLADAPLFNRGGDS